MTYENLKKAVFVSRPNRFVAHVLLDGVDTTVHVKNTGRCREILRPGATVLLEQGRNPGRKTPYSLIAVYKGDVLINIDSQAPNLAVAEALKGARIEEFGPVTHLKREVTFGSSRFDIYYEDSSNKGFIEVKGVTLETGGTALFPDAPTVRGARHVWEMTEAVKAGFKGCIFFLIQMKGVDYFTPNRLMDPEFSRALMEASQNGVEILAYDCEVRENSMELGNKIPVVL